MGGNNIPKEAGARPEIGQADVREEVEYSEKFGFPFIIAVTGLDKFAIIAAMERRLGNTPDDEFETALGEVEKIALIRLEKLIDV